MNGFGCLMSSHHAALPHNLQTVQSRAELNVPHTSLFMSQKSADQTSEEEQTVPKLLVSVELMT